MLVVAGYLDTRSRNCGDTSVQWKFVFISISFVSEDGLLRCRATFSWLLVVQFIVLYITVSLLSQTVDSFGMIWCQCEEDGSRLIDRGEARRMG